jgi:putative phosphoribosyl transferase
MPNRFSIPALLLGWSPATHSVSPWPRNEVAKALGAPLGVFVVRKLGVPGQRELAFGALASGGVRVLNEAIGLRLDPSIVDAVAAPARWGRRPETRTAS